MPLPRRIVELRRQLERYETWTTELPLSELRTVLAIMEAEVAALRGRERELDTLRVRIANQLEGLPDLEFLAPARDELVPTITEKASLESNLTRLTSSAAQLNQIIVACGRVGELYRRLKRSPDWPPARESGANADEKIKATIAELDKLGDGLATELKCIESNEDSAEDLLASLSTVDANNWGSEPTASTISRSADALRVLIIGEILIDRNGKLEPAAKDATFIAAAAACLASYDQAALTSVLVNQVTKFGLRRLITALSALNHSTMFALAEQEGLPPLLGEALYLVALAGHHQGLVGSLSAKFRGTPEIVQLIELTQQLLSQHPLPDLLDEVRAALPAAAASAPPAQQSPTLKDLKQAVIDKITHPPGMTRLHARLRAHAQNLFLRPLKELVEADASGAAREAWERAGSLDDKLQQCIDALEQVERRNLVDSHRHNTETYLSGFENALLAWEKKTRKEHEGAATVSLASLIEGLRVSTRPQNRTFYSELHRMFHVPDNGALPRELKPLCGSDDRMLAEPKRFIAASHIESFTLLSKRRPVPCLVYLADLARALSRDAPMSPVETIDEYLRRRAIPAARLAAGDTPALIERIDETVARNRIDILKKNEVLLAAAKKAAIESEEVSEAHQLFMIALDDENFVDAEDFIREIDEQLRRYRILQDPARRYAHKFLTEVGETLQVDAPLEELHARIDEIRSIHAGRRLHLKQFEVLHDHKLIGTYISAHAHSLSRRIDLPAHWPTSERQAREIAESIDIAIAFLDTRAGYHTQQPKVVTALIDGLPKYLVERLARLAEHRDENPLAELSNLIRMYHPADRIVECIGARAPHSEREHEHIYGSHQRSMGGRVRRPSATTASEGDFLREIQFAIDRDAQRWVSDDPGDLTLERAVKIRDWVAVRQIAARHISQQAEQSGQHRKLSLYQAFFAYAETRDLISGPLAVTPPSLVLYFVAVFWTRMQLRIWLAESDIQSIVVDALGGKKSIAERIKTLSAGTPESAGYMWFTTMISEASRVAVHETPVSALIADVMWSLDSKPNTRADLLHWLYQARRHEALNHLARLAPRPSFITQCIRAFERAESAPEARPAALQMAAAFREQAESKANTKPWTFLFLALEQTNPDSDHDPSPITISVPASIVQRVGDDVFEVMLYIEPRFTADPAETLTLEFPDGATRNLLDEDEDILNPREVPIQRPLPKDVKDGDIFDLPYTLRGRTFRGREFEARHEVTLELAGTVAPPLQNHELGQAWPGASGSPVLYQEGFFGRERECREIERCICADDRQRSLMLYGQRRVGKTSLLLEMVRRLPPDERRVTGMFIDVAGLDLPPGRSMSEQLFHKIVDALDDPRNEALKKKLDNVRDPRRLARNLQPDVSLFTALHSLKDRLEEASGGQIRRLALFIDEFDRFVEPLMSGAQGEKDADQLMWALRQIAQQSHDISLVLAGSGLQKVLTRDYDRPLYGSIDQVEIKPFNWASDKQAILDIFMPTPVRGRLVSGGVDDVGRHATQMCGGHPYFLALVGQAAGVYAQGRNVNLHLINAAARKLITGSLPDLQRHVDAQLFYAHIFETLRRVPQHDQRLAQLILVNIASRTTAGLPWLNRGDAIDDPDINRERESERERALQLLIDEGAIESSTTRERGAQVRIAVPLTALAVRHSETTIRRQALQWRAEHQGMKK